MWTDEDLDVEKYSRYCPPIQRNFNFKYKKHQKELEFNDEDEEDDDEEKKVIEEPVRFIPIPILFENDDDEHRDDDDDDDNVNNASGKLDKWDISARCWLSSGTMFLLVILFHVIQVRSDLRRFTSAANIQLHEACAVLEDKTTSLQTALSLAAQDVGPISFKFVRDLKTKIRGAFHFAGQIFGGRVREALIGVMKHYYCLFVGAVVAFKSLSDAILNLLLPLVSGDTFITDIINAIQNVLDRVVQFVTEPDKAFGNLFADLLGMVLESVVAEIKIPEVVTDTANHVCSNVRRLDFEEIHLLLRRYIAMIVAAITIILVFYNALQFLIVFDSSEIKVEPEAEEKKSKTFINLIPTKTLRNAVRWMYNFLSYQPFWIFLSMGVFGVLHLHFSRSLHTKAQELKRTIIDPAIDSLREQFTTGLTGFLKTLELSWTREFGKLVAPLVDFVKRLTDLFEPILEMIANLGKNILGTIDDVINAIESISQSTGISNIIRSVLDCLILRNFKVWIKIAESIRLRLFGGDKLKNFRGGIVGLLKKSIAAIFKKLQMTKFLKKLFSVSFLIFLKLVVKRSIFLYVYLIVCFILLFQGFLMLIIKFVLGYF